MSCTNPCTHSLIGDASRQFTHADSTGGSTGPETGVEVCCLRLPSEKTVITIASALNGQKSAWIGCRRSAPRIRRGACSFPPREVKKSPTSRLINLLSAVPAAGPRPPLIAGGRRRLARVPSCGYDRVSASGGDASAADQPIVSNSRTKQTAPLVLLLLLLLRLRRRRRVLMMIC